MGKVGLKPRKIACFSKEQQEYYNSLADRQRSYIYYRGQGYNKGMAYHLAGYEAGKNSSQAAHNLELKNAGIKGLVETLLTANKAKAVALVDVKSETPIVKEVNEQLDALAEKEDVEKVLAKVEDLDSESAKQIQFYRNIISGRTKTVRRTEKRNALNEVVSVTIEEISDVESKMKARKELDRILGLNTIVDIDKLKFGDITVNIVDASKKEELDDVRNTVVLDADKVEVIDGEEVIVEEKSIEIEPSVSKKTEFFNATNEVANGGE